MTNLKKCVATIFWILLALAGAWAYVTLAFRRDGKSLAQMVKEELNLPAGFRKKQRVVVALFRK